MEILKNTKVKNYEYCCNNCDNTFVSTNEKNPVFCNDCGSKNSFQANIIIRDTLSFICPMCKEDVIVSDFLRSELKNENALWMANMVTHYRHSHLKSWDKMWGKKGKGYRYTKGWYNNDYEGLKVIVNERAKRQILRKCKDFLISINFSLSDLECLKSNSEETLDLFKKLYVTN